MAWVPTHWHAVYSPLMAGLWFPRSREFAPADAVVVPEELEDPVALPVLCVAVLGIHAKGFVTLLQFGIIVAKLEVLFVRYGAPGARPRTLRTRGLHFAVSGGRTRNRTGQAVDAFPPGRAVGSVPSLDPQGCQSRLV